MFEEGGTLRAASYTKNSGKQFRGWLIHIPHLFDYTFKKIIKISINAPDI
jgi:hypothetical protein